MKNKKGFTLIEIIVVLIIIAILAAIAVPAMMKYINNAKDLQLMADMRSIYIAAQTVTMQYAGKGINVFSTTGAVGADGKGYYQILQYTEYWAKIAELAPEANRKYDLVGQTIPINSYCIYGNANDGILYVQFMEMTPDWRFIKYTYYPDIGLVKES